MIKQKLKQRPDKEISALCHRGSHQDSEGKFTCKGRSCNCTCHPINQKIPFCFVCKDKRTDNDNGVCRYCTGERSLY